MTTFSNSISSPPLLGSRTPALPRGLLGFGGIGGSQPPAGLLGRYYDPAEERRRKIFGAMTQAGIELLRNGRGNFGEVLGQGLAGAVQGARDAGQGYREDALGFNQLEQQQADRQRQIENDQFNRGRLIKQDAWSNTEHQRTLDERQRADTERKAQHSAIMDWVANKPPEFQAWAENFPEAAAKAYAAEMMPPENKEPTSDIQNYEYGLTHPGFAKAAGANGVEYGLQPIITQEPPGPNGRPGKYHLFQAAKDGSPPKEIPLPYGWTPPQQYLDTGMGFQAAPRQGVGNGAVIPKNVFEEAATKEGGKNSEGVPAMVAQDYLKPGGMKEQDDATIAAVSAIHAARKMLDRGIQTGALADKLQSLRSIGDALGFEVDDRVLTDTQTYQNFIRQTVIPKMKELGGNDSNEELRKMELLSGADIKQQDATIRATLDLTEKLMAKKFKSRELYRKATKKYFGDVYEIPELPTYNTTPTMNPSQGGPKVIDGYTIRRVQ